MLTKTKPYDHQARIIEETKDKEYFGLFCEQGTGKSHMIIASFTHLWREKKLDAVLILAPNGVHDNWERDEIPTHCNIHKDEFITATWHGNDGMRKRNHWNSCTGNDYDRKTLVILMANIEATRTETFMRSLVPFVKTRRFMLVVDESTTIKNHKAIQSKATSRIAKFASYRRILTGTPITQSPLDLYSQCKVLSDSSIPYTSYTAFKHQFAIEQTMNFGQRSFNKIVGYQNQEELARLIAPFTVRILKRECLDLPPKVYQTRYVELTAEQKRIYRDLVKKCVSEIGDGIVTVTTAITMMLRLHQVALGYTMTDDGVFQRIPHNRIAVLRDLLEESDTKAIIFCRFLEDVKQVREELICLNQGSVQYHSGVDADDRVESVRRFRESPDCRCFIATSAAAKGLTLTAAEQVIYYSQGFSLETRLQSEDRAHRIGQLKTVTYTDLVATGTVDDKVISALKQKQELANSVLDRASLLRILELEET